MSTGKKVEPSARVVKEVGIFIGAGLGGGPTREELLDVRRKMIAGVRGLDILLGVVTIIKTRKVGRG